MQQLYHVSSRRGPAMQRGGCAMERTLSPADLGAMLGGPMPVILLDVRRRPAFEADPRVIPGAALRDRHGVDGWAAGLGPGGPVVVYSVHGHEVSNGVVDRLRGLGLDAALVAGAIEAWRAAGGAVVPVPVPAEEGAP